MPICICIILTIWHTYSLRYLCIIYNIIPLITIRCTTSIINLITISIIRTLFYTFICNILTKHSWSLWAFYHTIWYPSRNITIESGRPIITRNSTYKITLWYTCTCYIICPLSYTCIKETCSCTSTCSIITIKFIR